MGALIGVVMIVKDEEDKLRACLDSVKNVVDEIVIVDTGSVDKTVDIARIYTDKIYSYPWQEDFSAARNFAIDKCSCKWILSLDADECLDTGAGDLRVLITNTASEAFFIPLKNCISPSGSDFNEIGVLRLFRNLPQYRFHGKIHEQISITAQDLVRYSNYPIIIHSYIEPGRKQHKRRRNINMITEQLKNQPENQEFLKYYLGCEWLGLGKYQQAYECFRSAYKKLDSTHIFFRSSVIRSLIVCLRQMEKFEEALALCMRETEVYPEYTDLFFDGGVVLEQMGEYEIARRWFKVAVDLGTPRILYQHSNGTEDFLAYYHLGHCCQAIGKPEEASQCYQAALQHNKNFFYPLYGLYMVLVTRQSCEEIISYFSKQGYIESYESRQALAQLLFTSGRPDLAAKVCTQAEGSTMLSCELAKYFLYSGNFKQAIDVLQELKTGFKQNNAEILKMEILAYIFMRDVNTAQVKCLEMWRNQTMRAAALSLMALIKRLEGRQQTLITTYEPGFVEHLLRVMADCLRSYGEDSGGFIHVAKCCEELISQFEEGSRTLLGFWQSEIKGVETLLDIRYQSMRGLYSWKKHGP